MFSLEKEKFSLLIFVILLLFPAVTLSEWKTVDPINSSSGVEEMLDNDSCIFRFRYVDNQHAKSGTYQDKFFSVTKVHQFLRNSADGEPYSQKFTAEIGRGDIGGLYFGGALSAQAYNTLVGLYNTSKNPWDLRIVFSRNTQRRQLSLLYYFYKADPGSNYSTTQRLDDDKITLEANCSGDSDHSEDIETMKEKIDYILAELIKLWKYVFKCGCDEDLSHS